MTSADQRMPSFGYPPEYVELLPVPDQIDSIRARWPAIKPDHAIRYSKEAIPRIKRPGWTEGFAVWIRPGYFSANHYEEYDEVLKALASSRSDAFRDSVSVRPDMREEYGFRPRPMTALALEYLMAQQPGDLIVVPAQFGIRHIGKHPAELFGYEFGVTMKDVATMLITHPLRIQNRDDLYIDCLGDEPSRGLIGIPDEVKKAAKKMLESTTGMKVSFVTGVPVFSVSQGVLQVTPHYAGPDGIGFRCGGATGFVPPSFGS